MAIRSTDTKDLEHLFEFARTWRRLRLKATEVGKPDYTYFSQFMSAPTDHAFADDTDFRPLEELLRRKLKPAWFHYFNMSKVLCGVRSQLVGMATGNRAEYPSATRIHAFLHRIPPLPASLPNETSPNFRPGAYSIDHLASNMDLFLELFPPTSTVCT